MHSFDMVVIGSGGGPDESNLSAYLIKPSEISWEAGIIALEAGSGQGALTRLLRANPRLFNVPCSASQIYSSVKCFLITHAHLDHISSLVLSAGSLGGQRKRIYATRQILRDLETVFSNRIWPNLASWNENDDKHKFLYSLLSLNNGYEAIYPGVSTKTFPLSHGCNELGSYESSAFFIRHDKYRQELLFFGDVEPDSVSSRSHNLRVWKEAAPKIPSKLSSIFIECSWPSGRRNDMLYGHLTPEHLVDELTVLATEVVKAGRTQSRSVSGALAGLRVYVMHCKDENSAPMREVIVDQVKKLVRAKRLGAEIIAVEQGMHIRI